MSRYIMREVGRRIISKMQELHKKNQRIRLVKLRRASQQAHNEHHDAMAGVRAGVSDVPTQIRAGKIATNKHARYIHARKKRFGKKE